MVMRSGVNIASQIDLSEAIITKQVPEAKLLSAKAKLTEQDTKSALMALFYTLSQNADIVHRLEVTPQKAMQAGAQFIMFKTENDYEQWAQNNKFQGSFKSNSAYMQSLAKQIESGNAVYINATSRGILPRISVLDNAQNGNGQDTNIQNKAREL